MTFSQYFNLVDTLARMSLKADSAQYYLRYVWWVLEPLLFVAVFYLVFSVILASGRADFLVFLMCGKLPFVWFSKSVNQASNSLVTSGGLIGRIHIPKTLFPMAVIQEGLYKQSVVFALLIIVLLAFGYVPNFGWLYLVPIMLTQYLMIVSCGIIGAVIVCYVRDFSMLISLFMTFLMFVSGIFWDVRNLAPAKAELVLAFNPIAFLLDAYRQVLMYETTPDLSHLCLLIVIFGGILAIAVHMTSRASEAIALKVITA